MIDNPIINSPFIEPKYHFKFDERGVITKTKAKGRRCSLYFTPIPGTKKQGTPQSSLDLDTVDRVEENQFINQVREAVSLWRDRGYPGTTQTSRRLLAHWNQIDGRDRPLFFCQREAIETAIFLAEEAPKAEHYFQTTLAKYANSLNEGLFRIALKMATGAGKTVVMSLLIAWQTLNKARNPHDGRFTDQFLVVAPGCEQISTEPPCMSLTITSSCGARSGQRQPRRKSCSATMLSSPRPPARWRTVSCSRSPARSRSLCSTTRGTTATNKSLPMLS